MKCLCRKSIKFEARCREQGESGDRVTDGWGEVAWKMKGGHQGIITRVIIFSPLSVTVCPLLYCAKAPTWQVLILSTNLINTELLQNMPHSSVCVIFVHVPFLHQTQQWHRRLKITDCGVDVYVEVHYLLPTICISHTAEWLTGGVGSEACREGLLWLVYLQGHLL